MSTSSIVQSPQSNKLSNLERREQARFEMSRVAGVGKFMYLLHSPLMRKAILPSGLIGHSVIDLVTILSDSKSDPSHFWKDTKKRILTDDPQLGDRISQLRFRNWNDGKMRQSDALSASGLVIVIFELHTPSSNELRSQIADVFDRYDNQHNAQIIGELENKEGWAATRNHIDIQKAGLVAIPDSELKWFQR